MKKEDNKMKGMNVMKKIFSVLLSVLLISILLCSCGEKKPTLKVYNTGEYIDPALLTEFEKEANCKVVYETFDSNETMYTKVSSGELYDIIIPSDYMIERLMKENMLSEIDWSLISNKDGLKKEIMGQKFDAENKYHVPYFWGSVGILYNKNVVDIADLESQGWGILKNTKYKDDLYMYDSERDAFMIALKNLGYSLNTDNTSELDAAYEWLVEQRQIMNPIYVGDDVIDNMISGNKSLAIVYSGDAAYIMTENPELGYYEPKEGTNFWVDGMVLTKTSENKELAHKFMNFMIREENAMRNSEHVGYSSSVENVFIEMQNTVYSGINAYVPRTGYENDESFGYQTPEIKKYSAELWTKVKSQN